MLSLMLRIRSFPTLSLLACTLLLLVLRNARATSAGTETLVGIVGADFVLLGADTAVSQSISLTASNLDKIAVLIDPFPTSSHDSRSKRSPYTQQTIAVAAAGDAADADRLLGLLGWHAAVREYEASVGCDVEFVDCAGSSDDARNPSSASSSSIPFTPAGLSVDGIARLARQQMASRLRSPNPYKVCLLVAGMAPCSSSFSTLLSSSSQSNDRSYTAKQVQLQVETSAKAVLAAGSSSLEQEEKSSSGKEKEEQRSSTRMLTGLEPRLFWLDEYGSIQRLQYGAHGFGANFALSILDQGYRPDLSREEATALLQECFAQLRTRYIINSPQPPCIKCIDANGCRLIR